jgi:hypothetical protein
MPLRYSALSYIFLCSLAILFAETNRLPSLKAGFLIWLAGFLLRFPLHKSLLVSEAFIAVGAFVVGIKFASFLFIRSPRLAAALSAIGRRYSYLIFLWHQIIIFFLGSLITKYLF